MTQGETFYLAYLFFLDRRCLPHPAIMPQALLQNFLLCCLGEALDPCCDSMLALIEVDCVIGANQIWS